ncbi:MGMT family protein [archaeon]|nr:MGMT family protein [archaeon]
MTEFSDNVYELLRQVPPGKVTTYKELANALNSSAYRAIGQIMKNNPDAPNTPCHRCVSTNGTIGGFNGQNSGLEVIRKKKILESEGITFSNNKIINFNQILYKL